MKEKDRLFLTVNQAVEAVAKDFEQYPFQRRRVALLVPMVYGDSAYVTGGVKNGTIWLKTPDQKKPIPIDEKQIGRLLIQRLIKNPPTIEKLAEICSLVFQTPCSPACKGESPSVPGIWVTTGMEMFRCLQCGHCCRTLDYRDGCSVKDYQRWQKLGRTDILRWVGVVKESGKVTACRIWMVPGTNRFADACPWLKRGDRPKRFVCSIHDVRPVICRQYPGSRKHARLTGCCGV